MLLLREPNFKWGKSVHSWPVRTRYIFVDGKHVDCACRKSRSISVNMTISQIAEVPEDLHEDEINDVQARQRSDSLESLERAKEHMYKYASIGAKIPLSNYNVPKV